MTPDASARTCTCVESAIERRCTDEFGWKRCVSISLTTDRGITHAVRSHGNDAHGWLPPGDTGSPRRVPRYSPPIKSTHGGTNQWLPATRLRHSDGTTHVQSQAHRHRQTDTLPSSHRQSECGCIRACRSTLCEFFRETCATRRRATKSRWLNPSRSESPSCGFVLLELVRDREPFEPDLTAGCCEFPRIHTEIDISAKMNHPRSDSKCI